MILALLYTVVFIVGLYVSASVLVSLHYKHKREQAQQKARDARQDAIHGRVVEVYKHLSDPDLQAATMKEIAEKAKAMAKGTKLAAQFEPAETTGA